MSDIEYITGRSYDECIKKLQSLYGANFQIVKKRFVNRGGFLGFFQQEMVQVSYIVTEKIPSLFTAPVLKREPERDFEKEKAKILEMSGIQNPAVSKETVKKSEDVEEDLSYQKILEEMKSLRADLSGMKSGGSVSDEPETIREISEILEDNDFSPSYIRKITERIRRSFSLDGLNDKEAVKEAVLQWIENTIQIDDVDAGEQPEIIILVGPTGVGKTTTVAKLAAKYSPSSRNQARQKKVHIITIDNYRIAGKDQIEKYGEIMGITVDGCNNAEEISEKVQQYAPESDLILIDTIGFSPRDCDNINRMKATLGRLNYKTTVYLAMMASTKAADMREIMHQFEIFEYDDVIITKLDETGCVGNLISVVSEKGKKLAYFTTGQRVPADIVNASKGKLTEMIRGLSSAKEQKEKVFPAE